MKKWLTPIRILLLLLLILCLGAIISWKGWDNLETWIIASRNILLISGASSLVHYGLLLTKRIKPTRWEHRAITNLILFLLFDPLLPWYAFVIIGGVTELAQRLIRLPTGPVFNPAALGVLLVSFFGFLPGWWGMSFAPRLDVIEWGMSISMLFVLPIAGYIVSRYRKLTLAISATIFFAITYLAILQYNPLFILLEGTWAFFILVMAVEPKTSPAMLSRQIMYGAIIGILAVVGLRFGLFDAFVFALLVANGLHQLDRWLTLKRQRAAVVAQTSSEAGAQT
ncbi:MAG: hypothetical protein WDZ94_04635 [Patescibacteria group bacterium]